MRRECNVCGERYESKRASSRYCSRKCSGIAARGPRPDVTVLPGRPDPKPEPGPSRLEVVVLRELEDAGRVDTVNGQRAILLAARLARAGDAGVTATLDKALDAVMEKAMTGVAVAGDPIDELRAKRDEKRTRAR